MSPRGFSAGGYLLLSLCGAWQWIHMLRAGRAEGVSAMFLVLFAAGLSLLQVSMHLERVGRAYRIGNGVGLANTVMMLGAWWWLKCGG
ncbi:MAG: hypothetical protein HY794_13415 [Desulfarculus sp.]|nr:hypothetical protein [Desulfarculus sp.]